MLDAGQGQHAGRRRSQRQCVGALHYKTEEQGSKELRGSDRSFLIFYQASPEHRLSDGTLTSAVTSPELRPSSWSPHTHLGERVTLCVLITSKPP